MVNDGVSVAKLKMFSPKMGIFSLNKAKKKKYAKARNLFCDEPTSVGPQGVTQHRIFIKFFFDSLGYSRFFR